jgi:hypothetical protein
MKILQVGGGGGQLIPKFSVILLIYSKIYYLF